MKKFIDSVWNFFVAWGEHRARLHRQRGYHWY